MFRLTTYRVILTLFVAIVGIHAAAAAPLTHEEALAKIAEWGPDSTADKIVALDTILQATQESGGVKITMPGAALFVIGNDVWLRWSGSIELDIAGLVHARITPDALVARGVIPHSPWWEKPIWGIGGGVATLILTGLSGHLK